MSSEKRFYKKQVVGQENFLLSSPENDRVICGIHDEVKLIVGYLSPREITPMDYHHLLKHYRKRQIPIAHESLLPSPLTQQNIEQMIPHRHPFLLIDSVTHSDTEAGTIAGTAVISASNPVFQGHFPGSPVYPGVLQVEMIGQMGLCLHYCLLHGTRNILPTAPPPDIRATKILGAHFLAPLLPDAPVRILAIKQESDGIFGTVLGQVLSGDTICTTALLEVYFMDDV
jgi:3-hydroxyacyl-[acyl-carrier-protein] dehydratase